MVENSLAFQRQDTGSRLLSPERTAEISGPLSRPSGTYTAPPRNPALANAYLFSEVETRRRSPFPLTLTLSPSGGEGIAHRFRAPLPLGGEGLDEGASATILQVQLTLNTYTNAGLFSLVPPGQGAGWKTRDTAGWKVCATTLIES